MTSTKPEAAMAEPTDGRKAGLAGRWVEIGGSGSGRIAVALADIDPRHARQPEGLGKVTTLLPDARSYHFAMVRHGRHRALVQITPAAVIALRPARVHLPSAWPSRGYRQPGGQHTASDAVPPGADMPQEWS